MGSKSDHQFLTIAADHGLEKTKRTRRKQRQKKQQTSNEKTATITYVYSLSHKSTVQKPDPCPCYKNKKEYSVTRKTASPLHKLLWKTFALSKRLTK